MKLFGYELDERKLAFLGIFTVFALALYQFKFSTILGVPSQSFTLFQFIGPIGAGIFSPLFGALSILLVEVLNFFISGKALEPLAVVRFFPMVFAAVYFGSRNKGTALVAIACMLLFWMHPIGQQAWFYPLYWLIPVAAAFYKQNIFVRSLGATFTAHAVGSVAFLYAFNLPFEVWAALIPIVAVERLAFASGITVSYYAMNTVLEIASTKVDLSCLRIEKKYALVRA